MATVFLPRAELQRNLHSALENYAEEEAIPCQGGAGEIPFPAILLVVGEKARHELTTHLLPAMRRRWSNSFRGRGMGKLAFCCFDRSEESPLPEYDNCFHYQLRGESLSTLEDNREDCVQVNQCVQAAGRSLQERDQLKVILFVAAEDEDSLIAGDVLAVTKEVCLSMLYCNLMTVTGELFVLLNDIRKRSEFNQVTQFFLAWQNWKDGDLPEEKMPHVYQRFEDDEPEIPYYVAPFAYQTYLLSNQDNMGVECAQDGRRAELMVDVIDAGMCAKPEGIPLILPGYVPERLNDEYVMVKAMNDEKWFKTDNGFSSKNEVADPIQMMEREIGNRFEKELRGWLELACIARREPAYRPMGQTLESAEKEIFGTELANLYRQWHEHFVARPLPDNVTEAIQGINDMAQAEMLRVRLQQQAGQESSTKSTPILTGRVSTNDVWEIREELISAYLSLAQRSKSELQSKWAKEALKKLDAVEDSSREKTQAVRCYRELLQNEERQQERKWNSVFYRGPELETKLDREEYRAKVIQTVKIGTERAFSELISYVKGKIVAENQPQLGGKIIVMCRYTDAMSAAWVRKDAQSTTQDKKVITFTKVELLDSISYFRDFKELLAIQVERK